MTQGGANPAAVQLPPADSTSTSPSPGKNMSHFGRSGPPDIRDTYSLLVLNITFRNCPLLLPKHDSPFKVSLLILTGFFRLLAGTTADDLFPLFDRYGKVVDVFIPRDRRTGESRGFAFVRYKYADEAQKAVELWTEERLWFSSLSTGRIVEKVSSKSRSRSPPPRYRDDYKDRDYRRRSRSRSRDRYDRDGYHGREREYRRRGVSRSPDHHKERGKGRYDEERRSRSASPARRSPNARRSPSPPRTRAVESPDEGNHNRSSPSRNNISPRDHPAES
ncbi:hypothetical protein Tsubulata_043641 [Turnera subulata]|uniref:RRM domain-containing protein n=1 Tax=Turnera subulata TaxID=218843 RepID=A0A9Q0GES1_9ROSI|nr:hypothetical protein Tsubulata_043641 [Turnera subulata]